MVTCKSWMVWPNLEYEAFNLLRAARAPGQPYVPVDNSAHPVPAEHCGAGVCCAPPSCAQGLPGLGSRKGGGGAFLMPHLGWLFLWLVVVACLALACASIAHWGWICLRRCRVCPCCPTLVRPVPLRGQARWIGGETVENAATA